jgi:O-antigen/teichoic acid export membrane protein
MIKKKVVAAMIWSLVGQIGSTGISTIFILIFARFMAPSDFGAFALGILLTSLTGHLAGLGLSTALIQRSTLDARSLSTAFWMSLGASLVLAGVLVSLSGQIALLFRVPRISDIILPLAAAMVIGNATTLLSAVLRRDLNMKALSTRILVANLVSGAVATPLAINGYGATSLVTQAVVGALFSFIATVLSIGWTVRLQFDRNAAKEMLLYGIQVMKSDCLTLFNMENPKLFISILLGADALGVYSMASRLLNLLLILLGTSLSGVALPLLSEIYRTTPEQVSEVHLRLLRLAGTIYIPVFLLSAVLSVEVIAIGLGSKWAAAAPVSALLCLAGIPLGLGYMNGATVLAIGHSRLRSRLVMLGSGISIFLLTAATPFGLIWVGAALLLRALIIETLMTRSLLRLLGRAFPKNLSVLKPAALAGIVLVSVASLVRWGLTEASPLTTLAICSMTALPAYAICIWHLDRDVVKEIAALFRRWDAA